jgi:hypothetical protein
MKLLLAILALGVMLLVAVLCYDACNMYILGHYYHMVLDLVGVVGITFLLLVASYVIVAEIRWQNFHDEE